MLRIEMLMIPVQAVEIIGFLFELLIDKSVGLRGLFVGVVPHSAAQFTPLLIPVQAVEIVSFLVQLLIDQSVGTFFAVFLLA